MKHFLFTVLVISVSCCYVAAQTVHELTDRKNIAFANNLKNYQMLSIDSLAFDIYYPTGAASDKKYPVYFSLHGGSFTTATKQSVSDFSDKFADYGFVVIAPDYRVGYNGSDASENCVAGDDSTGLQGAIYRAEQDVNACIRYIANHGDLFNIDTSFMFVGGASAGGTLALNVAYISDSIAMVHYPGIVATWGGLQNSGNTEPYNYTIKGISAMWGALPYWDGLINSKSAVPSILFKGGRDNTLPNGIGNQNMCPYAPLVRAGQGIYDPMTALGVPCVFHLQPNSGHAAYDNLFCTRNTACFFKGLLDKVPYSGSYQFYQTSCH